MIRLGVRVARERAEIVAAELLALSPGGLEERELDGGLVELAIYGSPGELADVGCSSGISDDACQGTNDFVLVGPEVGIEADQGFGDHLGHGPKTGLM